MWWPNGDFLIGAYPLYWLAVFSHRKELPLTLHSFIFFIDLFISSWTREFLFILWVVSSYWCYSFWSSNYSRFGQWEHLPAGFCVRLIHWALFIFKLRKISLVLSCPGPCPRISHFFKSLWFLLEDTDIWKSNLALHAFVAYKGSKWSENTDRKCI